MDLHSPLYSPFVRNDQYGTLGRKPQPLHECIRLALFGLTVVPLRFLGCLACVAFVWTVCRLSFFVPPEKRQEVLVKSSKRLVRVCLLFLGFTKISWVKVTDFQYREGENGSKATGEPEAAAIVSNHVSWSDILVHLEHSYCSFVARSNTQDMPLIGLISQHLQCIFVDRDFKRTKKGKEEETVKGASGQVMERVRSVAEGKADPHARPLLLFPEGTTTNGQSLLNFKTGAFLAGAPVQPVVLKYAPGKVAPAWESIDALWHVFLMLANLHQVTCYELPVYVPTAEESRDPKLYSRNVRAAMIRFGGFDSSDSTLQECRAYIALLEGKAPPVKSTAGQALLQGQKLPAEMAARYFVKSE